MSLLKSAATVGGLTLVSRLLGFLRDQLIAYTLGTGPIAEAFFVAQRFPNLMAKDAEIAVKEILGAIEHSLSRGDRVEIRGFGSFGLNHRPARTGRNPKTGKALAVPAKYVPHFNPGKEMRERVEGAME